MKSKILSKIINKDFLLIAEIGVNYYDIATKLSITPLKAAKLMILEAKKAGIHAVKFQTYKADTIASKTSPSYWDTSEEKTTSQYLLFKKYDSFDFQEYKILSDYCNELDIAFLSTAFDFESVDYLNNLMDVFKISSSDLNNIPFVEYQAKKNKPIILSIGASDEAEIDETIKIIRKFNDQPLTLLHCVLEYPTPYSHANLNKIISLKRKYSDINIGYSDHTKPDKHYDVIKTAYILGGRVIEKHFTLDKSLPGNDHYHSMDAHDAKAIIEEISFIESILGSFDLKHLASEKQARLNARRSIVANVFIKKGTPISTNMLTFKRPGTGIPPSDIFKIIGLKPVCDINEDTTITFDMFEKKPLK